MCHKNNIDLAKCEPVLEDTKDYLDSAANLYTLIKLNNKGLPESMKKCFKKCLVKAKNNFVEARYFLKKRTKNQHSVCRF